MSPERNAKTIEEYIAYFPVEIRKILQKIHATIREAAPDAEESISYGMPAFKTNRKPLVYFAAFKHHVGFYATPTGHEKFANKLARYKQGKGSVQFPLDQEMPYALIRAITEFRVKENEERAAQK